MEWEIYLEGFYKFLKCMVDEYIGDLLFFVIENGMVNVDVCLDGVVLD